MLKELTEMDVSFKGILQISEKVTEKHQFRFKVVFYAEPVLASQHPAISAELGQPMLRWVDMEECKALLAPSSL